MLLVITPSAKALGSVQAIQQITSEETHVAATSSQALAPACPGICGGSYRSSIHGAGTYRDGRSGTHVNFAINDMDQVARELRANLLRNKRQILLVRQEVQQALRNELKGTITALLLSCEMALQVPDLQSEAKNRMRSVHELAREIRLKLEDPV